MIANRIREVILNGKWIANTNYQELLQDVDLKLATSSFLDFNTIASLTFHIDYYLSGIIHAFETGKLEIKDKYSFDCPELKCEDDWVQLKNKLFSDAEMLAKLVEELNDTQLEEIFIDPKYGTYRRNIEGMIEHSYYHMGQIVLIKKAKRVK